jgi:hypothetical protein
MLIIMCPCSRICVYERARACGCVCIPGKEPQFHPCQCHLTPGAVLLGADKTGTKPAAALKDTAETAAAAEAEKAAAEKAAQRSKKTNGNKDAQTMGTQGRPLNRGKCLGVWMRVCVCVEICGCMDARTCACARVYVLVLVSPRICARVCICDRMCVGVRVHVHACVSYMCM